MGLSAVLMWSSLTALSVGLSSIPPFELMAITFAIGGVSGVLLTVLRGRTAALRQSLPVWAFGVGGIFGDYALYFASIRMAPAAQASLLSYLWPLFAVLFSALFLRERWQARHLLGACLGLAAVGVVVAAQDHSGFSVAATRGYAFALASAVVWAGYSTLSRRLHAVPPDATYGFCLGVAAIAAAVHLSVEPTVNPLGAQQWLRLLVIGIGPAGLAFAAWDFGVKRGDLRTLTVLSYATPVLSTLLLVLFTFAAASVSLAVACLLIALAGVMAAPRPSTSAQPAANGRSTPASERGREPSPGQLSPDIVHEL